MAVESLIGSEAGANAWRVNSYYSRHRLGMEVEDEVQGAAFKRQAAMGSAGTEQKGGGRSRVGQAPGLLVTGAAVGLGLGGIC